MSNSYIFALFLDRVPGCSAVRLAHLLWEQGVAGSNPATPTTKDQALIINLVSAFFARLHIGHTKLPECIFNKCFDII